MNSRPNALAVANYFIDIANREGKGITQLGLMKRVYIAHGFSLAIHHKSLLDPRFDRVEAWKYGPVIPNVYHSFKQYRSNPIAEKTVIMTWDEQTREPVYEYPELDDEDAKAVVDMVWRRYHSMSDSDMVALTHQKGTPWDVCYIEGMNKPIPDEVTELYYKKIVDYVADRSQRPIR